MARVVKAVVNQLKKNLTWYCAAGCYDSCNQQMPPISAYMNQQIKDQLAPTGVLRVGLNMSNFLLVNSQSDSGAPDGVSPAIARALGEKLGVNVELILFKGPGDVADAATGDVWDIANIAAEPERARSIIFSPPYCEIQATYLLPPDSPLLSVADVDVTGNRIAAKGRAAFELWLSDNLKQASVVQASSHEAAFDIFVEQNLEALAGLRPKLIEQQTALPGSLLLQESFTSVRQCIGCKPGNKEAAAFIEMFVKESVKSGLVKSLIDKYQVTGKLSVPSARN